MRKLSGGPPDTWEPRLSSESLSALVGVCCSYCSQSLYYLSLVYLICVAGWSQSERHIFTMRETERKNKMRKKHIFPFPYFSVRLSPQTCISSSVQCPTTSPTRSESTVPLLNTRGFPRDASGKEPACQRRRRKWRGFDPWLRKIPWRKKKRKIPWRRKWQPTPVYLPGESHGQMRLVGYSPWGWKELNTTERTRKQLNTKQKMDGKEWDCFVKYSINSMCR